MVNPVIGHQFLSSFNWTKCRDDITVVAVCSDGELYSATVADISSRDALIYKKPIRSEQHDSQWLNGTI